MANPPGSPRPPTARQIAFVRRLLGGAALLLAKFGRQNICLANLSIGMDVSLSAYTRRFTDMDGLIFAILSAHVQSLEDAVAAVPPHLINAHQLRRAAYFNGTRTETGALNDPHILLLREPPLLPADMRQRIEQRRQALGETLAGPPGAHTPTWSEMLAWMDAPSRSLADAEVCPEIPPRDRDNRPRLQAAAAPAPKPEPPQSPAHEDPEDAEPAESGQFTNLTSAMAPEWRQPIQQMPPRSAACMPMVPRTLHAPQK